MQNSITKKKTICIPSRTPVKSSYIERRLSMDSVRVVFRFFRQKYNFDFFWKKTPQRSTYQKTKLRLNIRCSLKGSTIINLVLIHKKFTHCPRLRIELHKTASEHQIILMEFCFHEQNGKLSLYNIFFLQGLSKICAT